VDLQEVIVPICVCKAHAQLWWLHKHNNNNLFNSPLSRQTR